MVRMPPGRLTKQEGRLRARPRTGWILHPVPPSQDRLDGPGLPADLGTPQDPSEELDEVRASPT